MKYKTDLPTPQSRIEKILNAILTKDMSDLPTPQSRIEKFFNAILTKDMSDLPIPQSRVEEFLNAILTKDTSSLPTPQSRIEKLLYSMATGDLENIIPPQSRIEYYLYLILQNKTHESKKYTELDLSKIIKGQPFELEHNTINLTNEAIFAYMSKSDLVVLNEEKTISKDLLVALMGIGVTFGVSFPKTDEEYWVYTKSLKEYLYLLDDNYLEDLNNIVNNWKINNNNKPDDQKDPLKVPFISSLEDLFEKVGEDVSKKYSYSNTLLEPLPYVGQYDSLKNLDYSDSISLLANETKVISFYDKDGKRRELSLYTSYSGSKKYLRYSYDNNSIRGDFFIGESALSYTVMSYYYNSNMQCIMGIAIKYKDGTTSSYMLGEVHLNKYNKPSISYIPTDPSIEDDKINIELPNINIPEIETIPGYQEGMKPPFEIETAKHKNILSIRENSTTNNLTLSILDNELKHTFINNDDKVVGSNIFNTNIKIALNKNGLYINGVKCNTEDSIGILEELSNSNTLRIGADGEVADNIDYNSVRVYHYSLNEQELIELTSIAE